MESADPEQKGPAPTTRTLGRDDWMTPPDIFDPLHALFQFTGDAAAANVAQSRCPQFLSPRHDALTTCWSGVGPRVWCNPPYGRAIHKWFARWDEMVRRGRVDMVVALVYANTGTRYWRDHVAGSPHCHAVGFVHGRVKFKLPGRPQEEKGIGAPKDSAVLVYSSLRRKGPDVLHLPHVYLTQGEGFAEPLRPFARLVEESRHKKKQTGLGF